MQTDFSSSSFTQTELDFKNGGLEIELDGPVVDTTFQTPRVVLEEMLYGTKKHSLTKLKTALRRASKDERVKALWLNLKDFQISYSNATDLRKSLEGFKASGKKIYVNMASASTVTYYLASVADTISLQPLGEVFMPGASFNLTYYGSALKKLGVEMEVVRVGKYKSFMEPFIMDGPSKASVEMYDHLAGKLNGHFISKVAASRNVEINVARDWLYDSFHSAPDALMKGMVDKLSYEDDTEKYLLTEYKLDEFVGYKKYANGSEDIDSDIKSDGDEKIAYIEAIGEIRMYSEDGSKQIITPANTIKKLKWAKNESDAKVVVLHVDSPGGSALAADMIWNSVNELSKTKKVVVSMGAVAASGGYYISAPAHYISAEPTTITGSIGVIGAIPNGRNIGSKWGVNFHLITQSKRKALLNFGERMSLEDKKVIQKALIEFMKLS